jgi:RNA polymerase-binding protein DksA
MPAKSKPAAAKVVARPQAKVTAKSNAAKPKARNAPSPARQETRRSTLEESRRPGPGNNGGPLSPPVPTNDKPRKNQAGLNSKELEHFRDLLLAKRREILGDMSSMEREALRSSGGTNLSTLPIHMADMGTDNYEQEFTLGLVETERKLLREINHALAKIQDGTYGLCQGTGQPISKARLEVQPWARYSIEYAKQMERGGR